MLDAGAMGGVEHVVGSRLQRRDRAVAEVLTVAQVQIPRAPQRGEPQRDRAGGDPAGTELPQPGSGTRGDNRVAVLTPAHARLGERRTSHTAVIPASALRG